MSSTGGFVLCVRWPERGVAIVEPTFAAVRARARRELARLIGGEPWMDQVPEGRTRLHLLGGRWGVAFGRGVRVDMFEISDPAPDAAEPFLVAAAPRGRIEEASLVGDRRAAWQLGERLSALGLRPILLPAEDARRYGPPVLAEEPRLRTAGQVVTRYLDGRGLFAAEIASAVELRELDAIASDQQAYVA